MYLNKTKSIDVLKTGSGNIQSGKYSFKAKGLALAAKKISFLKTMLAQN